MSQRIEDIKFMAAMTFVTLFGKRCGVIGAILDRALGQRRP